MQEVRIKDNWSEWIEFILNAVIETSKDTTILIEDIETLMIKTKNLLREKLPKIYSKDLLEVLFLHPYTKIEFLVDILGLHRQTASKYLKEIEKIGILHEVKIGRNRYFVNIELFDLLKRAMNE